MLIDLSNIQKIGMLAMPANLLLPELANFYFRFWPAAKRFISWLKGKGRGQGISGFNRQWSINRSLQVELPASTGPPSTSSQVCLSPAAGCVVILINQQLYTACEDLLKSIAGTFENNISDFSRYHLELLKVMSSDIPGIRPALLNDKSYSILDRLRSFRHFIRHGYDYDLDKDELSFLQNKLNVSFDNVISDVDDFELFLNKLVNESE